MFCAKDYKEMEKLGIIERANIQEEIRIRQEKAKAERVARTREFCENELSQYLQECAYTGETAVLQMAYINDCFKDTDKVACGLLKKTEEQYVNSSKISMAPDCENAYDCIVLVTTLLGNCYDVKTEVMEYYKYGFGKKNGFTLTITPKED